MVHVGVVESYIRLDEYLRRGVWLGGERGVLRSLRIVTMGEVSPLLLVFLIVLGSSRRLGVLLVFLIL
jgi:hypothetical protein